MQGDSWALGVAVELKNNQFMFGQNKSIKLSEAISSLESLYFSYSKSLYPNIKNYLQYGDSVLLGPSSHNDHKGEKEHVIVSGAYTFSSFVERILSLEKANEHLYNVGDNLSFYGTGLAGGWEIESPTFVQSQGIKTGMISQQLVHSYSSYTSVVGHGGNHWIRVPIANVDPLNYGIGLDMISPKLRYIKTPINSNGEIEIALTEAPSGSYNILLGDWHRGGWRKEFAQRLRLNIQPGTPSGTIISQNLLQYLNSSKIIKEGMLIPYQYYRIGGRVYLDRSNTELDYENWSLKLVLQTNEDQVSPTTESIIAEMFKDNTDTNTWHEFVGIGLLKSGISRFSNPKLSIQFENNGITMPSIGAYGNTILYIDELWIEHAGGVNYAHLDGCLDFGRYNLWPEQGSIEMTISEGYSNLYMTQEKHIIRARFEDASQEFWDQLEILLKWQNRGFCLNLHTNLNDYPYVMRGKIHIKEYKKHSWDLRTRSFTLEFIEE